MSFIRCTSNPEGLFVYEGNDEMIYFLSNSPENIETSCRAENFYELIRKIHKHHGYIDDKEIQFKNLSIQETEDCKIKLMVEGVFIKMFRITWEYIYNNVKSYLAEDR